MGPQILTCVLENDMCYTLVTASAGSFVSPFWLLLALLSDTLCCTNKVVVMGTRQSVTYTHSCTSLAQFIIH